MMGAAEKIEGACLEWLDTNQRVVAERLIDSWAIDYPNLLPEEIVEMAIQAARTNAGTAKDAADRIAEMRNGPNYCYLAFYGRGGAAQYMKVGYSAHPEQRLYGIATGNPLDCLWAFTAPFPTRKSAYAAEQAILREISGHKRRGEWIEIEAGDPEATALARQLGELVGSQFQPFAYRDGRAAA